MDGSKNSVRKYCSKVQSVRSVTFLSKTNLFMGPTIKVLVLNVMPLLCNFGPNLNICTILSALKALEYDLFFQNNTLIFAKRNHIFLKLIGKKETYDGEPSSRRIMSFMNTFWHLRTVRNVF